jgi:zinc transport system substrate-binding protein
MQKCNQVAKTANQTGVNIMSSKNIFAFLLFLSLTVLYSQPTTEAGAADSKLKVMATIFPLYDFARIIGGDKIDVSMILPPATDAHHYELKPDDIIKVSKSDIFLFTNFEMEQWAYRIIQGSAENTNMLAVETGAGVFLLPLNEEDQENKNYKFDPHIWLDFDNAQKIVDNIAKSFVKKDQRNSDYYLKNAAQYKSKLAVLDRRYNSVLVKCRNKTILHAGHWAFAYLAKKYNLEYIAAYNASTESEPLPQNIFSLIEQIKKQKIRYIYYEGLTAPRLAQTIAKETGAGLLKLSNGHDISKDDIKKGVSFLILMEENLKNLKKGLLCP